VRRPDRRGRGELCAFSATAREREERLRRVTFEEYDDLREVELESAGELLDQPLFLACTHGKHDPCCARYGRPLFEALAEQLDEESVWQSTHVGGDRFAGNLVCLPYGVYYGRVGRGQAVDVLDRHLKGTVALEFYRGRSAHPFAVQAAERDVREQESLLGLDDLRLVSARRTGGSVEVVFEDGARRRHERDVAETFGPEDYLTCKATEMHRPRRFVVTRR
jgi:hypothetical protein